MTIYRHAIGLVYLFLNFNQSLNVSSPLGQNNIVDAKKQIANEFENKKKEIPESEIENETKRFYAIDGSGMGSVNKGLIKCSKNLEVEIIGMHKDYHKADFSYFLNSVPSRENINAFNKGNKTHYYMVFAMESEPHSGGGETWINADFKMWYNLESSFPEPATYFDLKLYLPDLLAKPKVEFENKEKNPLVWVLSNCAAYNGREKFISKLMKKINIDSYGFCLRNKDSHSSVRMQGNIELYSKYKFVIAIENSNCEDYVTEKLVHAVASGSIPIVAGKNNKPNYLKFLPKNSFINIYDYKSVDDLVKHLKKIESDKSEYEKYIWFRRNHNLTREKLDRLSLEEIVSLMKSVISYEDNRIFFDGLVSREKSENKLCKIAKYLKNTAPDEIQREIKEKRAARPNTQEVCLPHGNLGNDLN
ncbi:glycosyltransferase family 10 [Brachionus plicatilis]|uniref:Fucosyltransferase n=1 Tax=Brachionus plicatilis TaxID=10195 RepID=A0A3M7PS79_BRAPC|nr:glycosyltransferase family 10 [Brachionus plicatilis]